jgi:hypothetical protein
MTAQAPARIRPGVIAAAIRTATATTRCDSCWAPPGTPCERGLLSTHAVRLAVAAQHDLIPAAVLEAALAGIFDVQNYTRIAPALEMP